MTAEEYLQKVGIQNITHEESLCQFATEFAIEQLKEIRQRSLEMGQIDFNEFLENKLEELKLSLNGK